MIVEDGLRERVKRLIQMEGLSNKGFAEKIGVLPQNLSLMLNGTRDISRTTPEKILAAFPEIRQKWLLFGEGEMHEDEEIGKRTSAVWDEVLEAEQRKFKTKPRLPVSAAAGNLSDYLLDGVRAYECEQVPVMHSIPDYDFTMIVKGNSMEPKFEGGDEIACKKVENVIEWGKTYVLATRDGAVLKRLYPAEHGFRCVSYNHDEYPDFVVDEDDVFGKYRVVGLIRI